ncbi:MAG TPA: VOC family protein [Thermoanaerobaculia bacterium]|nr:VOC family protein [Thermoanaerobaculia bacterium]
MKVPLFGATFEDAMETNVKLAVPFFMVSNMEASLRYYVDGLGFAMKHKWTPEGKLRWCWLELGDAALMLQELDAVPPAKLGEGVSIWFICRDAIAVYREVTARGVAAKRPFVGNGMWVTSLSDPDGYQLHFESETDAPEESELAD